MQVHAFGDVHIDSRQDRTDNIRVDRSQEPKELIPSQRTLRVVVRTDDGGRPQDVRFPRRGIPTITRTTKQQAQILRYAHKVHHRTVFKTVGKDILEVDALRDVYRLIREVLFGVFLYFPNL